VWNIRNRTIVLCFLEIPVYFPNINSTECCDPDEKEQEFLEACSMAVDPSVCSEVNDLDNIPGVMVDMTNNFLNTLDQCENGFPNWYEHGVEFDTLDHMCFHSTMVQNNN
jgi:hypothetical protein